MNRRAFVARTGRRGAAWGAWSVLARAVSPARAVEESIDAVRSAPEVTPINRTGVEATITERSAVALTVRLRAIDRRATVRPVVYARRFPRGRPFARASRRPVTLEAGSTTSLAFEFDDPVAGGRDRWLYEVRSAPRTGDRDGGAYLCESDPLGPGADRTDDPAPSPELEELEGRYERTFRWTDADRRRWKIRSAVSTSAYHEVRGDTTDYVSAYAAARSSPYAADFLDRLRSAGVVERPDGSDAPPSERELFDGVLGFVQSLEYALDVDSIGRPEYIRSVRESLVDGTGDCKDGSYLLAGLLSQPPFEYDVALVFMPSHMVVGIRREDLPAPYREAETIGERPYVPVETTKRSPVGHAPDDPVVAVLGDGSLDVDPGTVDDVLARQLELFAFGGW